MFRGAMTAPARRRRPPAAAPRGRRKLTTPETRCVSRHAEIATLPPRRRRAGGTRKGRQDQRAPDRSEALLQLLETFAERVALEFNHTLRYVAAGARWKALSPVDRLRWSGRLFRDASRSCADPEENLRLFENHPLVKVWS